MKIIICGGGGGVRTMIGSTDLSLCSRYPSFPRPNFMVALVFFKPRLFIFSPVFSNEFPDDDNSLTASG